MTICIDIGNTRTKASIYTDGKEVRHMPLFTAADLSALLTEEPQIWVSRSGSDPEVEAVLESYPHCHFLSYQSPLPITLNYDTPQTLGSDRIAAAVAAHHHYPGQTVLIIDLGTCLTVDLLDDQAVFQGGVISPGIHMRLRSMHEYTAALPLVKFNNNVTFPGKSSEASMQVGVYQSIINEVKGYVDWASTQYESLVVVDCSGGKIDFEKAFNFKIFAHPKFVLEGLKIIAEQNA